MVSRSAITGLFGGDDSRSLASFPLRAVYKVVSPSATATPVQILISVPKRRFHHAVDRNRVKRQVREAYRLHKSILADHVAADSQLLLSFVWLSASHVPSAVVERCVVNILRRIAEKL
jgi:ribonuclease P protein component